MYIKNCRLSHTTCEACPIEWIRVSELTLRYYSALFIYWTLRELWLNNSTSLLFFFFFFVFISCHYLNQCVPIHWKEEILTSIRRKMKVKASTRLLFSQITPSTSSHYPHTQTSNSKERWILWIGIRMLILNRDMNMIGYLLSIADVFEGLGFTTSTVFSMISHVRCYA